MKNAEHQFMIAGNFIAIFRQGGTLANGRFVLGRILAQGRIAWLIEAQDRGSQPPVPVMIVPLRHQADTIGVIYIGSPNLRGLFDERTVGIMQSFGSQVAIGLNNLVLHEQTVSLVTSLRNDERLIKSLNEKLKRYIEHLAESGAWQPERNRHRSRFFADCQCSGRDRKGSSCHAQHNPAAHV